MSTSIEVYPCKEKLPSLQDIIVTSRVLLNTFFIKHEINKDFHIELRHIDSEGSKLIKHPDDYKWSYKGYISIYIPEFEWVCFIDFKSIDFECYWEENQRSIKLIEELKSSLRTGVYWCLSGRSILKGFVAGALAKLSKGIIHSCDGGWDYNLLPSLADDFIENYMNPMACIDSNIKSWTEEILRKLLENNNV